MGMVNPMGWYDGRATPGPSPISAPKEISPPKAIDHAHTNSRDGGLAGGQQVWGGTETPGYAWKVASDTVSSEPKAMDNGDSDALGLSGVEKDDGRKVMDDDPDQVFTDSPEIEPIE
jgi:hypothetical protein